MKGPNYLYRYGEGWLKRILCTKLAICKCLFLHSYVKTVNTRNSKPSSSSRDSCIAIMETTIYPNYVDHVNVYTNNDSVVRTATLLLAIDFARISPPSSLFPSLHPPLGGRGGLLCHPNTRNMQIPLDRHRPNPVLSVDVCGRTGILFHITANCYCSNTVYSKNLIVYNLCIEIKVCRKHIRKFKNTRYNIRQRPLYVCLMYYGLSEVDVVSILAERFSLCYVRVSIKLCSTHRGQFQCSTVEH